MTFLETECIFPEDHKYLTFLKKVFRHEFRINGFRRFTSPVYTPKKVLENFSPNFLEKCVSLENGDFLRYNSSVSILQSYHDTKFWEESMHPIFLYNMENYFSKDENNKIISKYFINAEIIGEIDPILDAQGLYIISSILDDIGLKGKYKVEINSAGIKKEKEKYLEDFKSFFAGKENILTEKSKKLLEENPFGIFASKDEDEQILLKNVPDFTKFLKKDSKASYKSFVEYLNLLGINFTENKNLFPEEDFYEGNLWNITDLETGELISSSRKYLNLSEKVLSEEKMPGITIHVDAFKLIEILKRENILIKNKDSLDLFLVQLGDDAKKVVFPLSLEAREKGIKTKVSLGVPSIKEQMLNASKSGAKFVAIVGFMEAKNGIFQLRNMQDGTQMEIPKEELISYIISQIGENSLDFYNPAFDLEG